MWHEAHMVRLLVLMALLLAAGPAVAVESARAVSPHGTVSLVSDTDAGAAGVELRLGLPLREGPLLTYAYSGTVVLP